MIQRFGCSQKSPQHAPLQNNVEKNNEGENVEEIFFIQREKNFDGASINAI